MEGQYKALDLAGGYKSFQCNVFRALKEKAKFSDAYRTIPPRKNIKDGDIFFGLEYKLKDFGLLNKPDKPFTSKTIKFYFQLFEINYFETIEIEIPEEQRAYWRARTINAESILTPEMFVLEEMLKESDEIIKKRQGL